MSWVNPVESAIECFLVVLNNLPRPVYAVILLAFGLLFVDSFINLIIR